MIIVDVLIIIVPTPMVKDFTGVSGFAVLPPRSFGFSFLRTLKGIASRHRAPRTMSIQASKLLLLECSPAWNTKTTTTAIATRVSVKPSRKKRELRSGLFENIRVMRTITATGLTEAASPMSMTLGISEFIAGVYRYRLLLQNRTPSGRG